MRHFDAYAQLVHEAPGAELGPGAQTDGLQRQGAISCGDLGSLPNSLSYLEKSESPLPGYSNFPFLLPHLW